MAHEYKTVPAPDSVRLRGRGARGADALAEAVGEVLRAEAASGWEYAGIARLPVTESRGLLGARERRDRAVIVLRRPVGGAPAEPEAGSRRGRPPLFARSRGQGRAAPPGDPPEAPAPDTPQGDPATDERAPPGPAPESRADIPRIWLPPRGRPDD